MKFINLSMKNKIRIILIGLCLTILVAFMGVSYVSIQGNIIDMIIHKYWEVSTKQFEFIEHWMERRVEKIEKIAQSVIVIDSVNQNYEDGEISSKQKSDLKEFIDRIIYDQEVYIKIGVIDKKGRICYYSDNRTGTISEDKLFKDIENTCDIHIGNAYIESSSGKGKICQPLGYPVYEDSYEKGEIVGYVITYVNLDILDDSISMIDLGDKGYAYLVDKNGNVICSSRDYEFEKDENDLVAYKLIDQRTNRFVDSLISCFKTNHAGNGMYINHNGVEVIGVWKWYSYLEWVFLIEIEKSVALAQIVKMMVILLVIAIGFSIFAVIVSIYLSNRIVIPIKNINDRMKDISEGEGDLRMTLAVKSIDELGEMARSFDNFVERIAGIIRDAKGVSEGLAGSSQDISATISAFSDNAQNQAASAEEITATIEEVSAGVDNVADGAELQDGMMTSLISQMEELSKMIKEMGDMIKEASGLSMEIREQVESGNKTLNQMNRSMTKIGESSSEITNIVNIISDISDQINLLALNAAIEAARAGEQGRGFAVVADEISKLAEETTGSIKNIDALVKENEREIAVGRSNVSDTVKRIGSIIKGVTSIGEMMTKIFESMQKQLKTNETVNNEAGQVKKKSNEIRNATGEQKIAVNEIVRSITNMSDLIQSSAAGTEQLSVGSKEITDMAEDLKEKVDFFKV